MRSRLAAASAALFLTTSVLALDASSPAAAKPDGTNPKAALAGSTSFPECEAGERLSNAGHSGVSNPRDPSGTGRKSTPLL